MKQGLLGVTPHRAAGPPVWIAGSLPVSLDRAGRLFDGWIPNAGSASQWGAQWASVRDAARRAGRDPDVLTGAMYLTISIDADVARANERLAGYTRAGAAHLIVRFAGDHERHLELLAAARAAL